MYHVSLEEWLLTAEINCLPSTPLLIIMCGLSGSGKSTASRFLAVKYQAAWIRSDIERKRLFGLSPDQSSEYLEADIYTPQATQATFQTMYRLAEQLLIAGYPVIIDSCALKISERVLFRQLTQQRHILSLTVYCQASTDILIQRIQQRQNMETDPSEATEHVVLKQACWLETPSTNETSALIEFNSEDVHWQKTLSNAVKSLISGHSNEDTR